MAAIGLAHSVLITGTSAGSIGSALAFAFANRGLLTFATSRDTSTINTTLATLPNVHVLQLDVTSGTSVNQAIEKILAKTGGSLDYLVNNAGAGYKIDLVDADLQIGKQLFDVNVWGPLAVTKACTTALRRAKGTVVNISSVGAVVPTPWIGIYSASKAALTLMSETLRLEMAPLGVGVVTAMAGAVAGTNFHNNVPSLTIPESSPYAAIKQEIIDSGQKDPKGTDQTAFAEQLVSDILNGKKGLLWRGQMASMTKWLSKWLPSKVLDGMLTSGRGTAELQDIMGDTIIPPHVPATHSFPSPDPYTSSFTNSTAGNTSDSVSEIGSQFKEGRFARLRLWDMAKNGSIVKP